jgi:hypothetical protein
MDAWRPKHVEDYDTIKCLWKWKCIKLVTLLWDYSKFIASTAVFLQHPLQLMCDPLPANGALPPPLRCPLTGRVDLWAAATQFGVGVRIICVSGNMWADFSRSFRVCKITKNVKVTHCGDNCVTERIEKGNTACLYHIDKARYSVETSVRPMFQIAWCPNRSCFEQGLQI